MLEIQRSYGPVLDEDQIIGYHGTNVSAIRELANEAFLPAGTDPVGMISFVPNRSYLREVILKRKVFKYMIHDFEINRSGFSDAERYARISGMDDYLARRLGTPYGVYRSAEYSAIEGGYKMGYSMGRCFDMDGDPETYRYLKSIGCSSKDILDLLMECDRYRGVVVGIRRSAAELLVPFQRPTRFYERHDGFLLNAPEGLSAEHIGPVIPRTKLEEEMILESLPVYH